MLGVGGAFSRQWGTTCTILRPPSGSRWLIDCGRQAPDQIHASGLGWSDIEGLIVTHVHGDHVYGVEDFALRRYHERLGDLEPINDGGPRPKLIAHRAVAEELWQTVAAALRYIPDPNDPEGGTLGHYFDPIVPHAAEPPRENRWNHAEAFHCGELDITTREVEHVPRKPSTGLEISIGEGDEIAYWSGDAKVDSAYLIAIEPRTSVYFHDCTFIEYPGQVHGSFQLLQALPEAVRRKMVLMHHEDDIQGNRRRAEDLGFRVAMPGDAYDLVTGERLDPS